MELTNSIQDKLMQILHKLKVFGIIRSFVLQIDFAIVDDEKKTTLIETEEILRKCLMKVINKPRQAEIRNVITKLVKKKNDESSTELHKVGENLLSQKKKNVRTLKKLGQHEEYQCEICEKSFRLKKELKKHVIIHEKTQDIVFTCSICLLKFQTEQNLKNHQVAHRDKLKEYLCQLCGLQFMGRSTWEGHLDKVHDGQQSIVGHSQLECTEQSDMNHSAYASFVNETQKFGRLAQQNPFSAEGKQEDKARLIHQNGDENSVRFTASEGGYGCAYKDCGKVFKHSRSLKKHIQLKHVSDKKEYNCGSCSKTFREKGKLTRHLTSHLAEQFQCNNCEKKFSRRDALKRHIYVTHRTPKKFDCGFCSKSFSFKYNRNKHEENVHVSYPDIK